MDTTDITKITEYNEQYYAYIFDNLDEMDQFLKNYRLLKFTQGGISNLNSHITMKEIKLAKNLEKNIMRPRTFYWQIL